MTTVLHHMPRNPAERIKFCIVNCPEYPHLAKEGIKAINHLKKSNGQKLKPVVNTILDEWSLLHYAAEYNCHTVCRALLENGAEPDVKDKSGAGPLHIAARRGHIQTIQVLLENGADPLAVDEQRRTPCKVALYHYKAAAVAILKLTETKEDTIVPAVVQNQYNIERIEEKMQKLCQDMQANRKMNNNLRPPQRQRQQSETQYAENLVEIQSRISQLEQGCANVSKTFGPDERIQVYKRKSRGDFTSHVGQGPESITEAGVKLRVTNLENRVSKLERIFQPIENLKNEEEITLKRKLRKSWCTLKDHIDADSYVDYLFQEEALDIVDLKNIKSKHSPQERTDEMLVRLFEQKDTHWVHAFMERLQQENRSLFQLVDRE